MILPNRGRPVAALPLAGLLLLVLTTAAHAAEDDIGAASAGAGGRIAWMAAMVVLALLVLAGSWRRGARSFGILGAALILGNAAQIWLTQPLWYSNLDISPRRPLDLVMLALLGLQGAVSVRMLWSHVPGARLLAGIRQFGAFRIGALLAVLAVLSVSVLEYVGHPYWTSYGVKIVIGGVFASIHLTTLAALLSVHPPVGSFRLRAPVLAAIAFLASLSLGALAFQHLPHVEDEVAYMFQARTFAAGLPGAPAPAAVSLPGFGYYLLDIQGGRWISTTAPGWPAVLALGVLLGVPWLINPLLTALSVLLAHGIVRRTGTREQADLVALLMGTSPWVVAIGAGYMTHALTLFLVLLAWWCLLLAREAPRAGSAVALALAAGLAMGWVFTTRQLDGLIAGGLTGLWLLRRFPGNLRQVVAYGVGCVATGLVYLWYNAVITGNPLVAPLKIYLDRLWGPGANDFGFGAHIGPPPNWAGLDRMPGHSPLEGLANTANGLSSVNLEMLGWGIGGLAPILAFFLWGRLRGGLERAMLAMLAVVIVSAACYWFTGSFYVGPRYWYIALLPLLVLAASGIGAVEARMSPAARDRLPAILLLLCGFGLLGFTSWRGVAKYHDFRNFTAAIPQRYLAGEFGNALVFLPDTNAIGTATFFNDPFLAPDRPIFLRDKGPEANAVVAAAFPGRPVVVIPSVR